MPELPEVETIRRDLAPMLEGRRIVDTRVYHDDLLLGLTPTDFREQVHDRTFEGVERRAKFLLFQLVHHDTSDRVLLRSQLRMTGRFALGKVRPSNTDFRHPESTSFSTTEPLSFTTTYGGLGGSISFLRKSGRRTTRDWGRNRWAGVSQRNG